VKAGDNRDKPDDSRTSAFIRKYQSLMSSGDRLPPLAELAALFANDRFIDFTRNLIDRIYTAQSGEIVQPEAV